MTRFLSALVATFLLAGCGYHLGEIRPTPMRSVRTLAVPTFKNNTYEPQVEVLLADTLIKQLQKDGTYTVVSSNTADAILSCTLVSIDRHSIRSVENNVLATSEFALQLRVKFVVTDRVTGITLWNGTATGYSTFFANNDLQTTERQAISDAAQNLAENITTEISEGW